MSSAKGVDDDPFKFVRLSEEPVEDPEQPPRVAEEERAVGNTDSSEDRIAPLVGRRKESRGLWRRQDDGWCQRCLILSVVALVALANLVLLLAVLVSPTGWWVYALAGMYITLLIPAAIWAPFSFFCFDSQRLRRNDNFSAGFLRTALLSFWILPFALLVGGVGMLLSLSSETRLRVFACIPVEPVAIIFLFIARM